VLASGKTQALVSLGSADVRAVGDADLIPSMIERAWCAPAARPITTCTVEGYIDAVCWPGIFNRFIVVFSVAEP